MPKFYRENEPWAVNNGSGSGGNATWAANSFSTYYFKRQRLENERYGKPTYLRGWKVRIDIVVTATAADMSSFDVYWNILDQMIDEIHIRLANVDKRGPFRHWLRRIMFYENYCRLGILPNSVSQSTTYTVWFYLALNAPVASINHREDFDFPVYLCDQDDFITFRYANLGSTLSDVTGEALTIYLYPDVVEKNQIIVPFIEQFYHKVSTDNTFDLTNGESLYARLEIINPSWTVSTGAYVADRNDYTSISGKSDGRTFIEAAYDPDILTHFDWIESSTSGGGPRQLEQHTFATDTWRGVMNPNFSSTKSLHLDLADDYFQAIYQVPFGGKLSYALYSKEIIRLILAGPDGTPSSYHEVVYERLVPNKEIDELNKRIRALNGNIPDPPATQGIDALENWGIFSPYVIL
jgi:hypothetical protein